MKVSIKTDGGKWFITVDDRPEEEFPNRYHALIYLNNQTLTMVAEKEE